MPLVGVLLWTKLSGHVPAKFKNRIRLMSPSMVGKKERGRTDDFPVFGDSTARNYSTY